MQVRVVPAANGWLWIKSGFSLFRKSPLIWIVLTIILFAIVIALQFVPVLGPLVSSLLYPTFLAGLMLGCRDLEKGEELEIAHLFAGFQKHTAHLITIGGVYLVGQILIFFICVLIVGWDVVRVIYEGKTQALPPEMFPKVLLFLAIALGLTAPLLMVIWFAPLIVIFNDTPAIPAMKLSFTVCLQNINAFLVYGGAYLLLTIIAVIPLGLGLLIIVPLLFPTIYTSYIDIFGKVTTTTNSAMP
jgi:hypothetical protein